MEDPNHIVYIALGTNMGDRIQNLESARQRISEKVDITAESSIYRTPPWGFEDQPEFLNQVIHGETKLVPEALLEFLKIIERNLGRQPTFRNGPRVIDLDILLYDDLILHSPELSIPHPRMHERAFVLVPLNEIAADVLHPGLHQTIVSLMRMVDRDGVEKFAS